MELKCEVDYPADASAGGGTIQLRLHTPVGFVDLVFSSATQFLGLVAGQHSENAEQFLEFVKAPQPRQLPIVKLNKNDFYFDERLMELRLVENPHYGYKLVLK